MIKPVKVALFGCEPEVWEWALAGAGLLQAEVVVVADSDHGRARTLAERLGVRAVVLGCEMVEADPDVLLVTRPFTEARDAIGCAAMRGIEIIHAY